MASTSFSLPHFDSSPISVPMFHATDVLPAVLLFYGLAVAFLGFRLSRFFCFTLGLVVGAYYVDNLFQSQSNVRHLGLPLVVITLVALVSAVTTLLLHVVTLSALLGYVLALLVLAMDNGRLFGWGVGRWIPIVALQAGLLVAGRKNWTMLVVTATAVLGSLVTVLAIDHFADHTLSALLFTATYFRFLLGAQQAAPECGVDCWLLMLVWMVLSVVSFYVQLLLIQLQQTRLTKERQAVADDAVFSSTAFSYDTFSTSTTVKPPTLPQPSQLTPLVSSASSSSFVLPTKATYNFFDPQRLPENLQPLYPVIQSAFDAIAAQYGFQHGNVSNQGEHLLFLLGNVKSRGVNDAISRLHAKVFGNYVEWTNFLSLTAYCSSTAVYAGVGSAPSPVHGNGTYSYRASSSMKLQEIALWLCIWGEAGSLRHTPEALCYIYHNMGAELHVHRDDDGKQRIGLSAPVRRQGQFLTDVIQPIFEVMRAEKGDAETKFRNYDDWNEFFWSTHCLTYYFASPKYFVALSDDGESGGHHTQSSRLLPDQTLPPSVSEGLKAASKTHLERRSWLHPARSFMRLISFYFTIFHILVCIAYCRFRGWPLLGPDANRAISSFVISLAGWSVVKELIEIWAQYGIITQSVTNAAGFILRLGIKTVAFGYLFAFYQWSIDWSLDYYDAYFATACVYLLPYVFIVLAQIFPVLSLGPATATTAATTGASHWYRRAVTTVTSFWYPTTRLYVGHDVNESKQQTYTYQLFWLLLLSWKFYCSYLFQVTPLVEPTFQILTAKPKWTHIWHYNEIADTLSIFILWIPFVLVYTFDTVIWYFMFQAVVGVLVGMSDRLGEIREFSALISAFTSLPWEFERKLLAWRAKEPHSIEPTPHHHEQQASYGIIGSEGSEERTSSVSSGGLDLGSSADDDDSHPSSDESRMLAEEYDLPVLVDQFRSTAWQNFAVAWNEVVEDLRHDDLLSNAEKQQLVFRMVPGSRKELYIPILLTAGCYENAVEKVGDVAHTYNESQTDANKQICTERLMTYLNHPIRREGIMELWESTQWLLSNLLGDRHEKDLTAIYSAFESTVSQGQLLSVVNADNLTKLKPALLNFVRALRIAAASFTTFLESEKKRREAREGQHKERIREQLAEHERGMVSESDSEDEKDSPSSHPSSLHPLHASRADKLSLKSILKSPSVGTLNILDTIRSHPRYQHSAVVVDDDEEENGRQYVILHLNLVRDQLQQFLNTLQSLVKPATPEAKTIGDKCKAILHDHHGFAWDDAYAGKCVHSVLKGSRISSILTTLHAHLTVAQIDAEPSNSEATRRLLFFANSLFMHIPSAPSIASMKSFSTLTPFHSEDVLYSFADLEKQTEDGVSVFFYLQTIYPNEWANFLQRVGIPDNRVASILHSRKTMEARMWATNRGQTLGRTIDGMMLYEKALRLLAKLEQPTLYDVDIDELVKQKFQYVVSAQVYGKQKRESDPKATEIDIYLRKYPNMRVAYIDTLKVPRHDANGKHIVVEEHYSVLIKAEGGEIKEVYRVQLPGNPILGEGKPENQNQAVIFTRGEYLQTIDMNQSNGFEEALKMRNLLEEFNPRPGQKAVGIVGFREHIYTGGLSSIAQYMALQEVEPPALTRRTAAHTQSSAVNRRLLTYFVLLFVFSCFLFSGLLRQSGSACAGPSTACPIPLRPSGRVRQTILHGPRWRLQSHQRHQPQ